MSSFVLKLFAMLAMLGDHIAAVFGWTGWDLLPFDSNVIRTVGRISYPIFAFCIVNGWKHTRDREAYFKNLCLCAVFSQIPFSLAFYTPNTMHTISADTPYRFMFLPARFAVAVVCIAVYWVVICKKQIRPSLWAVGAACLLPSVLVRAGHIWMLSEDLNVLYTLALGTAVLWLIERIRGGEAMRPAFLWLCAAAALAIVVYGSSADYGIGFMGILLIVGLYLTETNRLMQSAVIVVWGIVLYGILIGNWPYVWLAAVSAVLILLYNGTRGYHKGAAKRLFYVFYPLHLLLLGLCNVLLKTQVI